MIVCVLFCMIYFCLGCGQEDETVFLEQKEELSEETEKTNETEVEKESKPKESEESETEDRENKSAGQEQICHMCVTFVHTDAFHSHLFRLIAGVVPVDQAAASPDGNSRCIFPVPEAFPGCFSTAGNDFHQKES